MRLTPRLSVHALVAMSVGALALAGGLLGALAIEPVAPLLFEDFDGESIPASPAQILPLVIATCLTTTLLLILALAVGLWRSDYVRARTVFACVVLGWLNAPLALSLGLLPEGPPRSASGGVLGLICPGVIIGVPLGLLYGAVAMMATARLRRVLDRPTLVSHSTAQQTVGLTVIGGALLGMIIASTGYAPFTWWTAPTLLLVGGGLFAEAWLRARRLRGVADDDPAYQRVAATELGIDPGSLLPLDDSVPINADIVLVHVSPSSGGAYRAGETRVPIALIA